jgi:hypothetical protein
MPPPPPPRPTASVRLVGPGAGLGGQRSAPAAARAGASHRHRTQLLTQSRSGPGPVRPPARARGSGWDGLNLHDCHQHGPAGQSRPALALGATRAARWCAGSGVGSLLPSRGSRSGGRPSDQGCRVWIAGSLATVGTAGSIRVRLSRNLGMSPAGGGPPASALDRRDVHHRGPGASRRVPYGGACPGLCRLAWIAGARGSDTGGPLMIMIGQPPLSVTAAPQSAGPWSGQVQVGSASGPGPVSTAARPQVGGPGRHTPGPGPCQWPAPAPPPSSDPPAGGGTHWHLARAGPHQSAGPAPHASV